MFARRYDQAIEQLRSTQDLDPTVQPTWVVLGWAYQATGRYDEAFALIEQPRGGQSPNPTDAARLPRATRLEALRAAYTAGGWKGYLRKEIELADERLRRGGRPPSAMFMASAHAQLGQRDLRFEWLERAVEARDLNVATLGQDPLFDNLRSDARFPDLLRRVGLAPAGR